MEANKMKKYFSTLEQTDKETFLKLPISDYSELGFLIESLVNVCKDGLELYGYIGNNFKSDICDYARVLSLISGLMPHNELELLTHLQNEHKPTTKPKQ